MFETIQALVVDDDPIARKTVRFALKREGFQCDVAIDGKDASRHLDNNVYALVVTDRSMKPIRPLSPKKSASICR